jgi:hypothetical protein
MAFAEINKAIAWSSQSTPKTSYPVDAFLVLHNGLESKEPVSTIARDQIWYVRGSVKAVSMPTPHLAGTLTNVHASNSNTGDLTSRPRVSVYVEIFPDGKLTISQLLDGDPIGGASPSHLQASDVSDRLIVAIGSTGVWTVGVARVPAAPIPQ